MALILVVDDEPLVGKTIERALTKVGHRVCRATRKEELQGCLREGPFELLILDLHMPDMSPEEVVSSVKTTSPSLKVLVVSGSQQVKEYPCLQKPFQIDELRNKVKELLDAAGA